MTPGDVSLGTALFIKNLVMICRHNCDFFVSFGGFFGHIS